MKIVTITVVAALVAAPALAAGWADEEVRTAAQPAKPAAVAVMPAPSTSNPMPMGVDAYVAPSIADNAAQVAAWEAHKREHGLPAMLYDRVWTSAPQAHTTIEIGHPIQRPLATNLVHDVVDHRYVSPTMKGSVHDVERGAMVAGNVEHVHDHHGAAVATPDRFLGPVVRMHPEAYTAHGPHHVLEIDVDRSDPGSDRGWWTNVPR